MVTGTHLTSLLYHPALAIVAR